VSEPTFRQIERVFTFARLKPVTVKGKTEPLPVWQPLAARARFGADVIRTNATPYPVPAGAGAPQSPVTSTE
jgi:hypothetical protein